MCLIAWIMAATLSAEEFPAGRVVDRFTPPISVERPIGSTVRDLRKPGEQRRTVAPRNPPIVPGVRPSR